MKQRNTRWALPLAAALCLQACSAGNGQNGTHTPKDSAALQTTQQVESMAASGDLTAADPAFKIQKTTDLDPAIVKNNTQFALEFLQKTAKKGENCFASPYSISSALAMLHAGATGETEKELQAGMHFAANTPEFHAQMGELQRIINEAGDGSKGVEIRVANRIWAAVGKELSADFTKIIETNYGAAVKQLDFSKAAEAVRVINTWVENQTNQKIKDLLANDAVDASTEVVLVNAIYFLGEWVTRFEEAQTQKATFYIEKGKSVETPFMNLKLPKGAQTQIRYAENELGQWLEMPYKGDKASMVILLPSKAPDAIIPTLDATKLKAGLNDLEHLSAKATISMPKWKMTHSIALNDPLIALGMKTTFSGGADLGKIPAGAQVKAIHKAFIEVNEKGTEAAAATAVIVGKSASIGSSEEIVFNANRPFLYFIQEKTTGSILFMGVVNDPTK